MKKHPLQASSVTSSSSIGSLNSITSMYSASVGKGDYEITGEVEVGVWYRDGQLFVRVVRAKGLAAAKKGGVSDPYIKTYLLPDRGKCSKRKTSVQRKTTNPVFNEILKVNLNTMFVMVFITIMYRGTFLFKESVLISKSHLSPSYNHYPLHFVRMGPCTCAHVCILYRIAVTNEIVWPSSYVLLIFIIITLE